MIRILHSAGTALAAVLCCTSCTLLSPEPDPTRYAVLAAVDELPDAARTSTAATHLTVGLGPIVVPEYLLNLEMQSRTEGTRLVPSTTERWGEPLDRGLERVLAIDLKRALGAERIVLHPWYATESPDVQVRITFTRFERADAGKVVVRATWSVRRASSDAPLVERETRLERATNGEDGASAALALSFALADLASEIAAAWSEAPPDALP